MANANVKVTFTTKCSGVSTPLTIDFDLSRLTQEDIITYALRPIIIGLQAGIRDLSVSEAKAQFDGKVHIVDTPGKTKKVKSLVDIAWAKFNKKEQLTQEEKNALITAATAIYDATAIEVDDSEFTITKE